MSEAVDLFGDPVPANWRGRGRPEHIATRENRDKVTMLLALGWSNQRISAALSITPPTLTKHYKRELHFRDETRDRMEAAFAMRIWREIEAGNVGAMRLFQQFVERNDTAVGHASFYAGQRRDEEEAKKDKPLGKKEEARQAARTAGEGTEWGDDLSPVH